LLNVLVQNANKIELQKKKLFYFAHDHAIMSCGIIFWGGSFHVHKVFILQNKIIRTITKTRLRDSCREVIRMMEIMMVYSQYIHSLLLFAINNIFNTSNEIHKYKTRFYNNLHLSAVNLTKGHIYQALNCSITFLSQ
jgi:hypothetical protein